MTKRAKVKVKFQAVVRPTTSTVVVATWHSSTGNDYTITRRAGEKVQYTCTCGERNVRGMCGHLFAMVSGRFNPAKVSWTPVGRVLFERQIHRRITANA